MEIELKAKTDHSESLKIEKCFLKENLFPINSKVLTKKFNEKPTLLETSKTVEISAFAPKFIDKSKVHSFDYDSKGSQIR